MNNTTFSLTMGGVSFKVSGDAFLVNLLNDRFGCFVNSRISTTNISFEIRAIDQEDLTLPLLDSYEKSQLADFTLPPFIGPGVLTIPFIFPVKADNPGFTPPAPYDYSDSPLLRSEKVRNRIDYCNNHADQVALASHKFSVTIRDYKEHSAFVFYDKACRNLIKKSEPAELFRRLFVSFFPLYSALLIHASCLVRNGRAALFLAPDQGGKSTVASMAIDQDSGATVPGDDRILIKKQEPDFFAFGSPWGNITDSSVKGRVSAVFLINKAAEFKLKKIDPGHAIEYLWHEHRYDRFFLTKSLKSAVFELMVDLCRQAAVYQMDFSKDYVDWAAVEAAMEVDFAQ